MTDNIKFPPMPKPHTPPVFATAANTPSVKAGYELGGYEKTPPLFDEHQLEAYAREAVRLNAQAAPDEPDWRHPKIQRLIGSEARLRIAIDLIWQILEDPNQEFTASDMEYWDTIHDKLKAAMLSAAPAAPQPAAQQGEIAWPAIPATVRRDVTMLAGYAEGSKSAEIVNAVRRVINWLNADHIAAQAQEAAPAARGEPSDPTKDDLADPIFEAIWQAIKRWDLSRDGGPAGYAGATGTDVMTILNAIRPAIASWAAERWHAEVANRPLVNVHRRTLDDTWRQVIRRFGVDAEARLGPAHDELVARAAQQKGGE